MSPEYSHKPQGSHYHLLKVAHEHFGCTPSSLDAEQLKEAQRIVSRQLLIEEAVLHSPEARGVVIVPSTVDEAWAIIVNRYDSLDDFFQALEDTTLDEAQIRLMLARELKVEAVLERVCKTITEIGVTEASLYYYNHMDQFVRAETREARHILITINPDFKENTHAAAQRRIAEIARCLQRDPGRFVEQALKHSECPTSLQEGRLGRVRAGDLYAQLDACLFDLEAGQLGGPVESPLGLHLLWCEAIHPATQIPLDVVLPGLLEKLRSRRRSTQQRQWLERLLQSGQVSRSISHG
ncbi:MAG TPA: nitrogen fixation protein NifM [Pseudomonas sp.]|jgi:peptidyl-prolyl cis-trans isomerase C|uniref:nitrogen fixation protein NifM n=1 Tax=Pseudomonas sp. TaxID=306 RepID=UPI002ED9A65C